MVLDLDLVLLICFYIKERDTRKASSINMCPVLPVPAPYQHNVYAAAGQTISHGGAAGYTSIIPLSV